MVTKEELAKEARDKALKLAEAHAWLNDNIVEVVAFLKQPVAMVKKSLKAKAKTS